MTRGLRKSVDYALAARPGPGRSRRLAFALLLCLSCGRGRPAPAPEETPPNPSPTGAPGAAAPPAAAGGSSQATHTEMRNVNLRIMEGATLHVGRLSGAAVSTRPGQPVVLDDKNSYVIRVESGEAAIGYEDLARVMNEFTFDFEGAPVKGLRMAREEDPGEEDEIQLTGKLRKALGVPFEIEGRPEATKDGKIRIRTTSIQALDIKVGGLLHALGMSPKSLLGDLEQRGVEVDGDDVILDPDRALPPPGVTGHVASVRVEDGGLVLTFATPDAAGSAETEVDRRDRGEDAPKGNYLWFRKGTIRIGRMTMTDADLRIVDHDPRDPLDFYGDRLTRQLVAGYAKLGATGGLTIIVPDYGDIR